MNVRIKLMIGAGSLALAMMVGCGGDSSNANSTNANMTNSNVRSSVEEMPATNAEFETTTSESAGVQTETRTYRNNSRISRVVITTRDGKRTAKVYSVSGEEKEIRADDVDNVLAKSGDAIADAAGFVADKAEDVGGKAKDVGGAVVDKSKDVGREVADKTEDVAGKTAKGAKAVGREAADKAEDVGGAVVGGAKTAGKKTVQGAKKVGGAIKDAVTP
jgi:hypothetical protein